MSKRKLLELVEKKIVSGWDDPRMPTISGMRRRGYTPEAIRSFCERIGIAKNDSMVDMALLEHCVREVLYERAPRVMAVLSPLRVVIENYPKGQVEEFDCPYHPKNTAMGSRKVPFSRELYIEADDFLENPPKKFYRLAPGREVRLRYGYFIKCVGITRNERTGEVTEVRCTYDPETRSGFAPDGRKVDATIHWVSAAHAIPATVHLYDRLFRVADPLTDEPEFTQNLDPKSSETLRSCQVEPSLKDAMPGSQFQFERVGYFCVDSIESFDKALVFNRTVTLRDAWAKITEKGK
jgi:glutaminyl-tRNA synthetase